MAEIASGELALTLVELHEQPRVVVEPEPVVLLDAVLYHSSYQTTNVDYTQLAGFGDGCLIVVHWNVILGNYPPDQAFYPAGWTWAAGSDDFRGYAWKIWNTGDPTSENWWRQGSTVMCIAMSFDYSASKVQSLSSITTAFTGPSGGPMTAAPPTGSEDKDIVISCCVTQTNGGTTGCPTLQSPPEGITDLCNGPYSGWGEIGIGLGHYIRDGSDPSFVWSHNPNSWDITQVAIRQRSS